ncbi:MAG: hypothetical protein AMS18_05440 [Gemmatimonas sp. SG8_17]|nr:MAG: hypothetical protein AMS18_05440 [Gemmatimonas sp. SG8_17]
MKSQKRSGRKSPVARSLERLGRSSARAVQALAPHARAAFAGAENLHTHTNDIAGLKAIYDSLTREAAERQLTWRY